MRRNLDCNVELSEQDGRAQITFTRRRGNYRTTGRDIQIVNVDPKTGHDIMHALNLMGAQLGSS